MKPILKVLSWFRLLGSQIAALMTRMIESFTGGFRGGSGGDPFFSGSRVPKLPSAPRRGASAANPLPARQAEPLELVGPRS